MLFFGGTGRHFMSTWLPASISETVAGAAAGRWLPGPPSDEA